MVSAVAAGGISAGNGRDSNGLNSHPIAWWLRCFPMASSQLNYCDYLVASCILQGLGGQPLHCPTIATSLIAEAIV